MAPADANQGSSTGRFSRPPKSRWHHLVEQGLLSQFCSHRLDTVYFFIIYRSPRLIRRHSAPQGRRQVFIIAEAGVNHNGCIKTAKKLIKAAADAGADAVKFQTFKAENIVTKTAKRAEYQVKNQQGND